MVIPFGLKHLFSPEYIPSLEFFLKPFSNYMSMVFRIVNIIQVHGGNPSYIMGKGSYNTPGHEIDQIICLIHETNYDPGDIEAVTLKSNM